jgi:hypothetical protein
METAFVSLICIALMVIGGMTMSQGFLHSIDNTSSNIQVISQRDQNIMRTNIQVLVAYQSAADLLDVSLRNSGQTKLANFDNWDVIVHYRGNDAQDHVTWLPFNPNVNGLIVNQWGLKGIYIDSSLQSLEVFDPGIFNPDEEMIIECKLSPPAAPNTINLVSVSTPNGITVSKSFAGFVP